MIHDLRGDYLAVRDQFGHRGLRRTAGVQPRPVVEDGLGANVKSGGTVDHDVFVGVRQPRQHGDGGVDVPVMANSLKIALAQLNFVVGDVAGNAAKIIAAIEDARERLGGLVAGAGLGAPMHEEVR